MTKGRKVLIQEACSIDIVTKSRRHSDVYDPNSEIFTIENALSICICSLCSGYNHYTKEHILCSVDFQKSCQEKNINFFIWVYFQKVFGWGHAQKAKGVILCLVCIIHGERLYKFADNGWRGEVLSARSKTNFYWVCTYIILLVF